MSIEPHPEFKRLLDACRKASARAWAGTVFRSATPRYATASDLVSGAGARTYGGRWNPPHALAVVYASTTPETALAEALRQARTAGIPDAAVLPRTFAALRVRVGRVLDLTDAAVRKVFGLSAAELVDADWESDNAAGVEALTQALGRAAFQAGFQALLVPSAAAPDGANLVVFPDRLSPRDELYALSAQRL